MSDLLIDQARVSTAAQDLAAQRDALQALGVPPDRLWVDHGLMAHIAIDLDCAKPSRPAAQATRSWSPSSTALLAARRPRHRRPKAKGRLRGKQPKLTTRQEAHLVALHRSGQHTSAELAELFNVTRSTVYRALERARNGAPAPDATQLPLSRPANSYPASPRADLR